MDLPVTDSDLRSRGIAAMSESLTHADAACVLVDGARRYAIVTMEHNRHFRECELLVARNEVESDLRHGWFTDESVEEHIR